MSDSLRPHGLQHARPPCPSPTPGVYSNSCLVGDAIQPSHPLSSPSPPALNLSQHQGLFQSRLFVWGGQSIAVSASKSALPMNTQVWSPLGWTGWTSSQSEGCSGVFSGSTLQFGADWLFCYCCVTFNGMILNQCVCVCVCVHAHACSLSRVWLFVTARSAAHQAPLSMDSPGKNTGEGCHVLLQGISPTQESNLSLLCLLH